MPLNHPNGSNPTASPCVMVIFGATGDLTKRTLIPALYNLAQDDQLPKRFAIVGFAGNDQTAESFRKTLTEEIAKFAASPVDPKLWAWFNERIYYVKGDFMSRKGVEPAAFTVHPSGIPHGPHPGTYEGSIGKTRTEELAVMVDTFRPLSVTTRAAAVSDEGYPLSWSMGTE